MPIDRISDMPAVPPLTCGTCRHWIKKPTNALQLGAEAQGDCMEGPPHLTMLPGPGGQQLALSGYPLLQASFPACHRHVGRVEV